MFAAARVTIACTVLALVSTAHAGLKECMEAVVRIRNGNSWGSGCVINRTATSVWILTNAHVAGRPTGNGYVAPHQVSVEFWRGGYKSQAVAGSTYAVFFQEGAHRDIALVHVTTAALGSYLPPAIPIAGPEEEADYRQLASAGCPNATWPNAWEGHALRRDRSAGDTIHFVPTPAPGRSGSPIFNAAGTKIIALIAWRASQGDKDGSHEADGYGVAMTHKEIWAAFRGATPAGSGLMPATHQTVQEIVIPRQQPGHCFHGVPFSQACDKCRGACPKECGPNGCPADCGPGGCFPPFGRRPQAPAPLAPTPQGNPFPGLPADLAPAAPVPIDTDSSKFVTRSEFESTAEDFRRKLRELAGTPDQTAKLDRKVEEIAAAVEEKTLRDKLRDVIASDQFRSELIALKNDVIGRLKESSATDENWKQRLTGAVLESVEARVAAVKGHVEQHVQEKLNTMATKTAPDATGGIWTIIGVVAGIGLPLAGVGGWQAYVAQAALARLAKRRNTPPEERQPLGPALASVVRSEVQDLFNRLRPTAHA